MAKKDKPKQPVYVTSYKVTPMPDGSIRFEFSDGSVFIMVQPTLPGMTAGTGR